MVSDIITCVMNIVNQPHPITLPFDEGYLPEANGHKVWYCQAGRPDGLPVIMLHGGPGYFSRPESREIFDPEVCRIIQLDQRGCGQSLCQELLTSNTTTDLVSDIERLRTHLKLDKLVFYGSSWGSTLALLYAQAYPKQVLALLLKSVFLAGEEDLRWSETAAELFLPEIWQKIKKYKQQYQIQDYFELSAQLLSQLESPDWDKQLEALSLLEIWENNLSGLDRSIVSQPYLPKPDQLITGYRVMLHYLANRCFLHDNQVLVNLDKIKHIPTWIIHGRYDMISPIKVAWRLAEVFDKVRLNVVLAAGHSGGSRLAEACLQATHEIATEFG